MPEFVEDIANIIDGLVVLLLVSGTVISFGRALRTMAGNRSQGGTVIRQLRVDLGQVLLLSLEVLIVSDILHSIVKRSLEELGMLAITVTIRIALAFFLDREITHLRAEKADAPVVKP